MNDIHNNVYLVIFLFYDLFCDLQSLVLRHFYPAHKYFCQIIHSCKLIPINYLFLITFNFLYFSQCQSYHQIINNLLVILFLITLRPYHLKFRIEMQFFQNMPGWDSPLITMVLNPNPTIYRTHIIQNINYVILFNQLQITLFL